MTYTLHVAWDASLAGYDFGPGHPMAPLRLKLTMELAQAIGLGRQDGVSIEVPAMASDADLELIHDRAYIGLVRLAGSTEPQAPDEQELSTRVLLRVAAGRGRGADRLRRRGRPPWRRSTGGVLG
jgi:acetoin utilization deacetylase AcuC-like enzyme